LTECHKFDFVKLYEILSFNWIVVLFKFIVQW
jgi:hypothetical protein